MTMDFQGLSIYIQHPKWKYGYIRNTRGADGAPVDIFVGSKVESQKVYVIYQARKDKPGEWKVVIGCSRSAEAKKMYHRKYRETLPKNKIIRLERLSIDQLKKLVVTKWKQ